MNEAMLHLSAGQGPAECEWVVARLAEVFGREAAAEGIACVPVESLAGPCASLLLRVSGAGSPGFVAARTGTIRWIGTSPFRPAHKRRNWFVALRLAEMPEDDAVFRDADIRFQAFRASGPGGQHVNTTDSAVRATHVPTGLVTVSQDQRSQFANRRIARMKIALLLDERRMLGMKQGRRARWSDNRSLERGDAVRTYEGIEFRLR